MSNHLATLKAADRTFVLQDFSRPVWTEQGTEQRFIPNPATWLSEAITLFGLQKQSLELILVDGNESEFPELESLVDQITVRQATDDDLNLSVTPFS